MDIVTYDEHEFEPLKARWAEEVAAPLGRGTDRRTEVLRRPRFGLSLEAVVEKIGLGNTPVGYDLRGIDLSNEDVRIMRADGTFEGMDLTGVYFQGADLGEACLEGAILRGAHLERANLWGLT